MKPGEFIRELDQLFSSGELASLLNHTPTGDWNTLDVDYEPPRVERVWIQHGDYRVCLHYIHEADKALYHPHPWPSVIAILQGVHEVCVGTKDIRAAHMRLPAGCTYEMSNPLGWHYVLTVGGPSLSIMLTWPPYDEPTSGAKEFGKGRKFKSLTLTRQCQIIAAVKDILTTGATGGRQTLSERIPERVQFVAGDVLQATIDRALKDETND